MRSARPWERATSKKMKTTNLYTAVLELERVKRESTPEAIAKRVKEQTERLFPEQVIQEITNSVMKDITAILF